jgi:uncharacterized membrane protein
VLYKTLLGIVGGIVGLIVMIGVIGCFLPKQRKARKVVEFEAPVDTIWEVVSDMGRQAEWRPSVKRVEVQLNGDQLARWVEYPQSGLPIFFKMMLCQKPSLMEFEFTDQKVFKGYWAGEFQSLPDRRTRLSITETAEISHPVMRVLSYLFFNMDRSIEEYLGEVRNRLGEKD